MTIGENLSSALEKLNNLKPLFSHNEEFNISKEVKENALA